MGAGSSCIKPASLSGQCNAAVHMGVERKRFAVVVVDPGLRQVVQKLALRDRKRPLPPRPMRLRPQGRCGTTGGWSASGDGGARADASGSASTVTARR